MRVLCLLFLFATVALAGPDPTPFPSTPSPKGLQVQMLDDAVALGIHHAGLNLTLNSLLASAKEPHPTQNTVTADGFTFGINEPYAEALDRQIQPLSSQGIVVTLILITSRSSDERIRQLTVHPKAVATCGTTMAANTVTPEGRACYKALTDFVARRWSSADAGHGRVWAWVIGNEVNSHDEWHQMGPASVEEVASQYEDQVRLAWESLRHHSEHARVYLSLEHHWTTSNYKEPLRSCPGRTLLELFAQKARERGDFDWNVAFHPYPADLFDPRVWLDNLTDNDDAPKVTFRNLEVLPRKLSTPELLYCGQPRRIALTEQGFHCTENADGQTNQAAAYVYAWEKISRLRGTIDAFLYHRHVDHAKEGGLRVGLWSHSPGSISTPERKRLIWDLLKAAETPDWESKGEPYLKVCGLKSWEELSPR